MQNIGQSRRKRSQCHKANYRISRRHIIVTYVVVFLCDRTEQVHTGEEVTVIGVLSFKVSYLSDDIVNRRGVSVSVTCALAAHPNAFDVSAKNLLVDGTPVFVECVEGFREVWDRRGAVSINDSLRRLGKSDCRHQ